MSLSGLTADPASLGPAGELADALDVRGVPLSHLFRPRLRREAADPAVVDWLRGRRVGGDAVLLHGFDHTPDPIGAWQRSPVRLGRRAEFAVLPEHEAGLRVVAARRAARAAGLDTDLFAPPRWLASPGTVQALRASAFVLCADDGAVHALQQGTVVASRVLGFRVSGERRPEDRHAAESWRCRVLVAEAGRVARRGGLVRLGLRAKDLRRPLRVEAALSAVDAVLAAGAHPLTYADGVHAGAA
ncbi:DUF2334 domain-containing protein [Pseudonocardia sulfidoxydans NBRC 16205]|uniref:DUF2334 domain-containing protein n=1 Tax=Pseudonocardia sulfidoxydans NBRC 16205 TaxID=1223511 RepID=A0A511DG84_9PSEU|nr:DUF2334 domain-containing protein [Pseudonocardia sulfidoxydans NBRC 16205]